MNPTRQLHEFGQSIWFDGINRGLLTSSTLKRYIDDYCVTGLTSNPTIFDHAIEKSAEYDASIQRLVGTGLTGEKLFFEIALEDLRQAADLFAPAHKSSDGMDGWVSLEVSPVFAFDTQKTIDQAVELSRKSERPNVFIKIPGTAEGVPAIEECTFRGVPVNVTLLFSRDQYVASAEAYLRGIERRIAAGLDPRITSVASVFVSRWDKAVMGKVPESLRNQLGYAVSLEIYKAYIELLQSERYRSMIAAGGRIQRLLWASTGTKDPSASDVLYIEALIAPNTINTMPEETLLAFADHGKVGTPLPKDGGEAERLLAEFRKAGVDIEALGEKLQRDGAEAFVKSWNALLSVLDGKAAKLTKAG